MLRPYKPAVERGVMQQTLVIQLSLLKLMQHTLLILLRIPNNTSLLSLLFSTYAIHNTHFLLWLLNQTDFRFSCSTSCCMPWQEHQRSTFHRKSWTGASRTLARMLVPRASLSGCTAVCPISSAPWTWNTWNSAMDTSSTTAFISQRCPFFSCSLAHNLAS